MIINAQIREWLKEQIVIHVDEGDVRLVQCALQGHPESVSIWTDMVESYLKNNLNFKSPVREPCLCIGTYEGHTTLVGRQVYDFKASGLQDDELQSIFTFLKTNINIVA